MSQRFNFTMSNLRAIEPPVKGRLVLHDSEIKGLICRVTPNGRKTFCVYRKYKNRPEKITFGSFPDVTVENARKLAEVINGTFAQGVNPAEAKRAQKSENTFQELFNLYMEKYAKTKKVEWAADINTYKIYWEKTIGRKKLSDITRSDLAEVHLCITTQAVNPNAPESQRRFKSGITANRALALVSSVFGWSIHMGIYDRNPATGIKRFPEKTRERFLQEDEIPKFFESLAQVENGVTKDFIMIALLTGARRSNVSKMKWDDISLERKEWLIPETKNGEPLVVALSNDAMKVLNQRKGNGSQYVFQGDGKAGHIIDPKKAWKNILKRAGIKDLRFHDLRRTLGSWQAKTGSSTIIIGKSLGHKSSQSTAVYSRLDLNPVRQSVNKATVAIIKASRLGKNRKTEFSAQFNSKSTKNLFAWLKF